ncbi:hypothetical protein NA56DRAFT_646870 [Hyaloscypha hepaticicola]|uniref:2EXR domain-containing protein n=1 Tax=Hyaloscypha hepaticicola TaxID=2082293 RepID=A0A2J6Q133_9HELO|nr:hypothetical protein NA56DRAFT_646870 [Hyaloscypha hepaticicola]
MDKPKNVFTVFPKLPPELRNRIWGLAANNELRTLDIASIPYTLFARSPIQNLPCLNFYLLAW